MNDDTSAADSWRKPARLRCGFVAALVLVLLAEALVTLHPHFAVESVFGFHAGLGFIACAAIVFVGRAWARVAGRPAAFYGRDDDD